MFFAHAIRVVILTAILAVLVFMGLRREKSSFGEAIGGGYISFMASGLLLVGLIPFYGDKINAFLCKVAGIISVKPLEGATPLEKLSGIPLVKGSMNLSTVWVYVGIALIVIAFVLCVLASYNKGRALIFFPIASVLAAVVYMQALNGALPVILVIFLGIIIGLLLNSIIPYRD